MYCRGVGDYMTRERASRKQCGRQLLLIQSFQFLHAAKGDPVNDRLIYPHHECWRNDELPVFVIDLVHCLSISSAYTIFLVVEVHSLQ